MGCSNQSFQNVILFLWALSIPSITGYEGPSSLSLGPHCSDECGNIKIPYPFGIEEGCYFKEDNGNSSYPIFKINCNLSTTPPTPIFGTNLEVLNISLYDGELRSKAHISYDCYQQNQSFGKYISSLYLGSFTLSSTKNTFMVIGCDTYAWLSGVRNRQSYYLGCMTDCSTPQDIITDECVGSGCCQTSIAGGVSNINVTVGSFSNHSKVSGFNPCGVGFAMAKDALTISRTSLSHNSKYYDDKRLPVVFNWGIGLKNCSAAQADGTCLCKTNTVCYDPVDEAGYRCNCAHGFSGNPYLPQGCSDVDECKEKNECEKAEYCFNTIGSYYCKCPEGYQGNGTKTDRCIPQTKNWHKPVIAVAGVSGGIIILLVAGFILHWRHEKRKLKKMRESFFHQNGGLILHQKLSRLDASSSASKIFAAQDLENATNKYSDGNIIGRGGFGIVYKGTLPNKQLVAIKKSLKVDPSQVEQFVNEIVALSQINNRNVVKLLGCCLETEIPLLVYEFINNGTLYDHLDDEVKASVLTWDLRLKIASEVANVLSYLHNTISTPIIHRDMKSMNILLDESYTAKVTDFGASRLVPIDQVQLATVVLGTLGYLDPEYMQTSELTEKSDVYSFGVVLLELLTRKKAVSNARPEIERCLAMHFLVKMKEYNLFYILDKNIVKEGTIKQIEQVASLAKWCLQLKGEDRPTMKEVAIELEGIKRMEGHPWDKVESFHEDCESLLGGTPRYDSDANGGNCSNNVYDPPELISSLEGGR